MEALFSTGPVYDPHVIGIIKYMLSRLKNNHPRPDSKVYIKNANYIKELYEGRFHTHVFNTSRKDYNYTDVFLKIRNCSGNWQNVRNLIVSVLDNIELSKDKQYLPFNKKFIETITFSTFFEYFDINAKESGMNSNFLNYINPPLKSRIYASAFTISKLKENVLKSILPFAEKISNSYFKDSNLSFWYNMEDLSRWLKKMKEAFPSEYGEFIISCKNGNPLEDFMNYLTKGGNIIQPFFFQLSLKGSDRIEGRFSGWLNDGIRSGKFSSLKNLPKSIECYYTDENFEKRKKEPKKKEVVDLDDFPIF